MINADGCFLIGREFSEKVEPETKIGSPERGKITICTFDQLVATAEKRLCGLTTKLSGRYDYIPGIELLKKQGELRKVDFTTNRTNS